MSSLCVLWIPLMLAGLSPASAGGIARPLVWDERTAEHLFNRAAFGATPEEVRAAVALGREATIAKLLSAPVSPASPSLGAPDLPGPLTRPEKLHERVELRRTGYVEIQSDHIAPLGHGGAQWAERMLAGADPLRERMTLFWHGHLVSSYKDVGDPFKVLAQIEFLRTGALGRFDALLRGIARDPAMLQYLGNAKNVKDHPNENWARELMELFALGDGHYTEDDVKEVARAFTGWSDERGRFVFRRVDHDFGQKTVLGRTGAFDGDDVIDRILAEPACARFLAAKLVAFFEGRAPDERRTEEYAAHLRENGYEIAPFLRRLLEDDAFYRDEIVGQRIASPVEYVVGVAHRLGVAPPGEMIVAAATVLGQRLYYPPSVKGWDPGRAWITTGTLMQRSNVAGALLGEVQITRILRDEEFDDGRAPSDAWMHPAAEQNQALTAGFPMLLWIEHAGWKPKIALGARIAALLPEGEADASDRQIVAVALDAWLAVSAAPSTEEYVTGFLREERLKLGLSTGELFAGGEAAETLLARLAHLVESLPEAQLE